MFDFPDLFYKNRRELRLYVNQLSYEDIPSVKECLNNSLNPIAIFLLSGLALPNVWTDDLKDWQINFYNRILPTDGNFIKLPFLFLALLTHFLEMLSNHSKWQEYDPAEYRKIIFVEVGHVHSPLEICDPLGIVDDFIETLSILWANRDQTNLEEFEIFKFNGVGLLEGKKRAQQKFQTILAYCGGYIERMGKCGNSPLIVGMHKNCPDCGKLICEICGHCNHFCRACTTRMKEYLENGIEFPE